MVGRQTEQSRQAVCWLLRSHTRRCCCHLTMTLCVTIVSPVSSLPYRKYVTSIAQLVLERNASLFFFVINLGINSSLQLLTKVNYKGSVWLSTEVDWLSIAVDYCGCSALCRLCCWLLQLYNQQMAAPIQYLHTMDWVVEVDGSPRHRCDLRWANRPMRKAHGLQQTSQVHIVFPLAATGSFLAFRLATRAAVHLSSKADMAFEQHCLQTFLSRGAVRNTEGATCYRQPDNTTAARTPTYMLTCFTRGMTIRNDA